jgi:hypothetical protein
MTDKMLEFARMAGISAPPGSDTVGLRDFNWRLFGELIVRNCIAQCREVGYEAMEIEIEIRDPNLNGFERGNKSGRKLGAFSCVGKIAETYELKV